MTESTPNAPYLGGETHQVADDAHLVRMRPRMRHREHADDFRIAWIGDVENRRAFRTVLMADEGIAALDHDLSAAWDFHAAEMADIVGMEDRCVSAFARSGRSLGHGGNPVGATTPIR